MSVNPLLTLLLTPPAKLKSTVSEKNPEMIILLLLSVATAYPTSEPTPPILNEKIRFPVELNLETKISSRPFDV